MYVVTLHIRDVKGLLYNYFLQKHYRGFKDVLYMKICFALGRCPSRQTRFLIILIRYNARGQIQAFQRVKSAFYVKNQSLFVPLVREQIQAFQRVKSEFYFKSQSLFVPLVRQQILAFQRLKSAFYVKNQSLFVPLLREQF